MKVKVISLPYIFQVLYVLCFSRPRYQVSVYRTIGPLVMITLRWTGPNNGNRTLAPNTSKMVNKNTIFLINYLSLAHLSRRLIGELIVYPWSGVRRTSSVRPSVVRRRPQCSNIFFSETAGPIKAKFYVEPPWVGGTIFCSRHMGHMTKMAATPIYGKNL